MFPEHTQVHHPAVTTALPPSQTQCSKEAAEALGSEAIPKSLTQQSEHLVGAFSSLSRNLGISWGMKIPE